MSATTSEQKARAWDLAAHWVEVIAGSGVTDLDADVKAHILAAVVPSLRTRAKIIRDNAPRRIRP